MNKPEHKFKYNGKEKQEEFGLNWLDYHARQYNSQIARFSAIDPLSDEYESFTPYHYVMNNPLIFIDPTGAFTVYYNDKGERIGEDEFGESDGRHMVVKNKEELEIITRDTKEGRPTMGVLIDSGDNFLLPEANTIYEMGLAVQRTRLANDKLPDNHPFKGNDDEGGFHEEGGSVYLDKKEGEVVVPAKPGKKAKLSGAMASIRTEDAAKGYEKLSWGKPILYTYHTHTSKNFHFRIPMPEPSKADVKAAGESDAKRNFVLAIKGNKSNRVPGRGRVYIYDSDGIQASFSIDQFLKLGKKKK